MDERQILHVRLPKEGSTEMVFELNQSALELFLFPTSLISVCHA